MNDDTRTLPGKRFGDCISYSFRGTGYQGDTLGQVSH
jgi:hypothetical protein